MRMTVIAPALVIALSLEYIVGGYHGGWCLLGNREPVLGTSRHTHCSPTSQLSPRPLFMQFSLSFL